MRYLLVILLLHTALFSGAQTQQQINNVKTVVDHKTGRWLDSLMAVVGDKRIVALGEDTHGTGDFYELRAAITRRLIMEKGFNTVILENPHEDMMALQEGLPHEKLDTLMRRHLFAIYQTKQMKDFLVWVKKYTRKGKALRLAGCDDSFREILPQALIRETAKYGNNELNHLCQEFLLRQTLSIKAFYQRQPSPQPDSLPGEMAFGLATYRLLERIDTVCQQLHINSPETKELIFHAKTSCVYYERVARKAAVSRDEIMADRINYYAADSNAKIIVWAHNAHVAKYAWLYDELGLMGATVAKQFPGAYLSIGMSSGEGSYSYIKNRFINDDHHFTDTLYHGILRPNKTGSWNELLMNNVSGDYFLDFSRLTAAERTGFDEKKTLKLMGYGKQREKEEEYYEVSLARMFDILIFLRKTAHTTALFPDVTIKRTTQNQ
ncbi:erythromycin esterase family protein [Chitinophaga varians]|uniref:erythromycin esterase family protein n=1 Tax=Chitinophaga varians TaxID=2202339 RepID=UPI00165ECE2D|nr:erythromycin esterase family protein [Chitinophaga varians]MBC9913040.1 erythromycin esterase family protein [Chitinophaga varians]